LKDINGSNIQQQMLKNNMDKEFDYSTVKDIVLKSLEKIVRQEALKDTTNIPDDVVFDSKDNDDHPVNVNVLAPLIRSFLKLKITEHLDLPNVHSNASI
jgi:hypothetical protein